MRQTEVTELRPGRREAAARVRPRAVWQGLSPAAQARVRRTFLRVLQEALGAAGAVPEGSRDASGR